MQFTGRSSIYEKNSFVNFNFGRYRCFFVWGKRKKTLNIVKWLSRSDLSLMTKQKRTVADFQIFADKIRSVDKVRLIC